MDWKLVLTTFGMVFLAELGDKTQLLVFTISSQHRAPWPVFLGASLALSLVSLLGAFLGGIVGEVVPTKYVQLGAGALFVGVGGLLFYRALTAG
ncbi:TMEM165/GDT1 family protein [Candidatus Bipolaricaulota bacterium]|nr:TMEM165/GDT1 family protein [Candidatus Bipolaricaulota bacterium]